MIQIEESNPSFESCYKCIYSDDSEEMCILRQCIHAVSQLKECYVPKQPTFEPQRKKGKWIDDDGNAATDKYCATCSACGEWSEYLTAYCPNCGAEMLTEDKE